VEHDATIGVQAIHTLCYLNTSALYVDLSPGGGGKEPWLTIKRSLTHMIAHATERSPHTTWGPPEEIMKIKGH